MNTHSMCCSGVVRAIAMVGMLFLMIGYASSVNAAQGCGRGYHQSIHGGCVKNYPGAFATPAPYHPGCWRNRYGNLRCP